MHVAERAIDGYEAMPSLRKRLILHYCNSSHLELVINSTEHSDGLNYVKAIWSTGWLKSNTKYKIAVHTRMRRRFSVTTQTLELDVRYGREKKCNRGLDAKRASGLPKGMRVGWAESLITEINHENEK